MWKTTFKKHYKRAIVLSIIAGVFFPILFVAIKQSIHHYQHCLNTFLTPQEITFEFHHIHKQNLVENISLFIREKANKSLLKYDEKALYAELKKAFPIIKKIVWHFTNTNNLSIIIYGTQPYCLINDHYVLGDKKRLFNKELFDPEHIKNLKNITVAQRWLGEKIDGSLYKFVKSIKKPHWENYAITYFNSTKISLIPHKALCRCRILTTEKTFFAHRKFKALGSIFKDLCNKQLITKKMLETKKNIAIGLDFRIPNQIIVSFYESAKRGRGS